MQGSIDNIIEGNDMDADGILHSPIIIRKTKIADMTAVLTYSVSIGVSLDIFTGVGSSLDIAVSRAVNMIIGVATAPMYGRTREFAYEKTHTTKHSNIFRKYAIEVAAFNFIPTITYGIAVGVSSIITSFINDGNVDVNTVYQAMHKAWNSYLSLVEISPIYSMFYPLWNNITRKIMGVKTPDDKSSMHYHENGYAQKNVT